VVDVIVVGAGPAGTSTAEECAKHGLDVLILERNQEIGTPVRCGEGLSDNSVKRLKLKIPSNCIAQRIRGAEIYAPNGKRILIQYEGTDGYILERKMFDKWLAKKAAKAGARIICRANVVDVLRKGKQISGVKVKTMDGEKTIESKVVVGADGVESIVARKAGLKTNKKPMLVDSGFEYEMSNIDIENPELISLFFGTDIAPRGYVWIFPKGQNTANVGVGIGGTGYAKTAKDYLDEFISNNPGLKKGAILEVKGGAIPVGGFLKNMVMDGLVVVGDAANQVNPIHGGGIAESITAGRILGPVISEAIKSGDVSSEALKKYNEIWWKERGNMLTKVEKVRQVFEKMTDEQMNNLIDVLSGEDLYDLAHGKGLIKLSKIFIKYKMKNLASFLGF
jgi:digeranylgeranylglycerophospholipid reductase